MFGLPILTLLSLFGFFPTHSKFSEDGGIVEFHISLCSPSSDPHPAIKSYSPRPRTYEEGKVLRFIVKDYGKGIKEEDLERIFVPFRQASQSSEVVSEGTGLGKFVCLRGVPIFVHVSALLQIYLNMSLLYFLPSFLGLSITSKLVHGMGGMISVSSVQHEWTEFTLDFPVKENDCQADVTGISERLRHANIILVGNETSTVLDQVTKRFQFYKVDYVRLSSMKEIHETLDSQDLLARNQRCIFMIHEDLFDKGMLLVYDIILCGFKATVLSMLSTFCLLNSCF